MTAHWCLFPVSHPAPLAPPYPSGPNAPPFLPAPSPLPFPPTHPDFPPAPALIAPFTYLASPTLLLLPLLRLFMALPLLPFNLPALMPGQAGGPGGASLSPRGRPVRGNGQDLQVGTARKNIWEAFTRIHQDSSVYKFVIKKCLQNIPGTSTIFLNLVGKQILTENGGYTTGKNT